MGIQQFGLENEMQKILISPQNSDVRNLYKNNGYVTVKDAISKKALGRLQTDLIALFNNKFGMVQSAEELDKTIIRLEKSNPAALYDMQIAATRLSSLYAISGEIYEFLVQIAPPQRDVFLNAVGFLYGIPASQRLSYDWHQDGTYHHSSANTTIHVWFPIFYPATFTNGAMSLLERSHNLGLLDFSKHKFEDNGYTTNRVADIENCVQNHQELICEMHTGDCMFFCDELIHKSNLNQTTRCRIAGVMKFSLDASHEVHSGLVGV
jgi:ectoine hydroxylase-related dioxygenase (phytanoyl-CoA dioxygenase family)